MNEWDSKQYVKFEKERTRPSEDLISRIDICPRSALDIGCGPGNSTARLAESFHLSDILGIDSSENMLEKAHTAYPNLHFQKCIVPDGLDSLGSFDLIFSNACLHWIPNHKKLLPALLRKLNDGGMLAVQMPLTRKADFYRLLNELISTKKWKKLQKIQNFHNLSPEKTYDILIKYASEAVIWETIYYHILPNCDSVLEWYKGSGLKPYLDALSVEEKTVFLKDLSDIIKENYLQQADNSVILKMPRMFFTAKNKF